MAFVVDKNDRMGRVVDLESGVVLLDRPQPPDDPHKLELTIRGKNFTLEVELREKRIEENKKFDVYWKIEWVFGHGHGITSDEKKEIVHLVEEALKTYGLYGDQERANSVSVDFNQTNWG